MLVKKSEVKDYLKKCNVMVSGDLFEALDEEIKTLLDKCAIRCKANGRKTVSKKDL